MESLRVTESQLTQLIDNLQQDQTVLFNKLKNAIINPKRLSNIRNKSQNFWTHH